MTTHARRRGHRSLEIDPRALRQRAQVRPAQRLRRHADLERRPVERGEGQARAIDADAVAERGVREDLRAVGDGEGGAAAAAGAGVEAVELGDGLAD